MKCAQLRQNLTSIHNVSNERQFALDVRDVCVFKSEHIWLKVLGVFTPRCMLLRTLITDIKSQTFQQIKWSHAVDYMIPDNSTVIKIPITATGQHSTTEISITSVPSLKSCIMTIIKKSLHWTTFLAKIFKCPS